MLHCGDLKNELLINTGRRGYAKWTGTRYTYRFMKFNFNFRDYQNKPVYQESIFTVLDSGDTLIEKTNQDGNAKFFVPIERVFEVSTKHKVIKRFEIPDDGYEAISLSFKYRGQSSKAIEKEEKEKGRGKGKRERGKRGGGVLEEREGKKRGRRAENVETRLFRARNLG